jgi:CheY-like chemotaxis protein
VTAVWNGKEALDYLEQADSLNPPHPKPDIILMDVQMPIIDGYRATHLIRHHSPYNVMARNIPIVAMTASAIQGDREKCKKAGMDDYLSKPVKGKTLEKMLVRWAISKRYPGVSGEIVFDGSDCSEPGEHNCGTAAIPIYGQGKKSDETDGTTADESISKPPSPPPIQNTRPTIGDRQNSHHLRLPGPESEADRAERREEAEEKAISLRDEKLVEAGGLTGERMHHENINPAQRLTVENVGKLDNEAMKRNPRMDLLTRNDSKGTEAGDTTSSLAAEDEGVTQNDGGGDDKRKRHSGSGSADSGKSRPPIHRRWKDSDRTVRPSSP